MALSFDEAIGVIKSGGTIVIDQPYSDTKVTFGKGTFGHWDINFLDLAERRGWPIHEVDS